MSRMMINILGCTALAILSLGGNAHALIDSQMGEPDAIPQDLLMAGSVTSSVINVHPIVELEPSKSFISLGDLVSSRNMSATAKERLASIHLADAPKPGESRAFTDLGLNEVFKPVLASIEIKTGEHFTLRVPSRVTVSKRRLKVRTDDVEKELLGQFKMICAECQFELSQLNIPVMTGLMKNENVTWKIAPKSELPKGSFSLPMEVSDASSGAKRVFWISGQLSVKRSVPVLMRSLASGEHMQVEDFSMQLKDVTFAQDNPAQATEILASVTARPLNAGQILFRSSLRREMAVKQGDAVKVSAAGEAWQITVDGISQASGYVGDVIRVKIPRTQKMVAGVLKEKGLVEVQ